MWGDIERFSDLGNAVHPLVHLFSSFHEFMTNSSQNLHQEDFDLIQQIPVYEKNVIYNFRNEITRNVPIEKALQNIHFKYSFNIQSLQDNTVNSNFSNQFAYFVYFQIISFLFCTESENNNKELNSEMFSCLITSITLCLKCPYVYPITFLFLNVLTRALNDNSFQWDNHSIATVITHFNLNTKLPSYTFPYLVAFCKIVLKCPQWSKNILELIEKLLTNRSQIFNDQDLSQIFKIIRPYFKEFNKDAFMIIKPMSNYKETKFLINEITNFPKYLLEYISKFPQSLNITQKEITDDCSLIYNQPTYAFDYVYVKKKFSSFPNGLRQLNLSFYGKQINLFLMLSEEVQRATNLLSKTMKTLNEQQFDALKKSLYEEFSNNLNNLDFIEVILQIIWDFPNLSESFFDLIIQSIIFDYKMNLFNDSIDPIINQFRNDIIKKLIHDKITLIPNLFFKMEQKPILFAETIGRIYLCINDNNIFDYFLDDSILASILGTSFKLQKMNIENNNKLIIEARNTIFLFVCIISRRNPKKCISSEAFVNLFFPYFMEDELSNIIFEIIKELSISSKFKKKEIDKLNPFINFFKFIIKKCIQFNDDENYLKIIRLISSSFIEIMKSNPIFTYALKPLSKYILEFIFKTPDISVIASELTILSYVSRITLNYQLNFLEFKSIFNIFNEFEEETKIKLLPNFMNLINGSTLTTFDDLYPIETPSFITLISSIYGITKMFPKILKHFYKLAKYSLHNIMAFHEGSFDLFMLKIIESQKEKCEFFFCGCKIQLILPDTYYETLIFPFLSLICDVISNYPSASEFCSLIFSAVKSKYIKTYLNFLTSTLIESNINPKIYYPIGKNEPIYQTTLPKNCFNNNNGFLIKFILKVDTNILSLNNSLIQVLSLESSNNTSFSLFLCLNSLYAKYEYSSLRTIVRLCDCFRWDKWTTVMINVKTVNENSVTLTTFLNNNLKADSDFCPIHLKNNINLIIGGINVNNKENKYKNRIFGLIGDIKIYPESYNVKNFKESNLSNNYIFDLQTIKTNNEIHSIKSLPLAIIECKCIKTFIEFFKEPKNITKETSRCVFTILKELLIYNEEAQLTFEYTKELYQYLLNSPELLDYYLFHSLLMIYDVITYENLKIEWFDQLIFNCLLWSQSNITTFSKILLLYSIEIIPQNLKHLKNKSYFKLFLSDYLNNYSKFNDNIKKLYIIILKKLALIYLDDNDIIDLFQECASCTIKEQIFSLLDIINIISSKLKTIPTISNQIVPLFKLLEFSDSDIYEPLIITIHELVPNLFHTYSYVIYDMINNNIKKQLFNSLLTKIKLYPNLYILLCILANEISKESKEKISEKLPKLINKDIYLCKDWFVWPITLCFNVDEIYKHHVCIFLAHFAINEMNSISKIVNFLSLFSNNNDLIYKFLNNIFAIINKKQTSLSQECCINCAENVFFHLYSTNYTNELIKEYNNSLFCDEIIKNDQKQNNLFVFNNIEQLYNITQYDINQLKHKFQLTLTENKTYKDINLMRLCLQFAQQKQTNKTLNIQMIIEFLLNKNNSQEIKFINEIDQIIDQMFNTFRTKFVTNFEDFKAETIRKINFAKHFLEKLQTEKIASTINLMKFQNNSKIIKTNSTLLRDYTFCQYYTQPKLKLKNFHQHYQFDENNNIIYEQKCILYTFSTIKECKFILDSQKIQLLHKFNCDIIQIKDIEMILKKAQPSFLEIFCKSGKSFLIDFSPTSTKKICQLINITPKQFFQNWTRSLQSNFEYIMLLNLFSGRTLNNPDIYPIFPSVISSFDVYKPKTNIKASISNPKIDLHSIDIENVINDKSLAPEYFYMPEIIKGKLPKWAPTMFHFVYMHRKILESSEISSQLPNWIDSVFGINSKPLMHKILFNKLHGNKFVSKSIKRLQYHLNLRKKIIKSFIIPNNNNNEIILIIITNMNTIRFFSLLNNRLQKLSKFKSVFISKDSKYFLLNDSLIIIKNNEINIYNKNGLKKLFLLNYSIINHSNNTLIYSKNYNIYLYNLLDNNVPNIIYRAKSQISCIELNNIFHVIAFGTFDCLIHIINSENGSDVTTFDLNGELAEDIIITDCWGFIVIRTDKHLIVLNINGNLIQKISISYKIMNWFKISSVDGFDYICVQNENGDFGVFEVIEPAIVSFLCKEENKKIVGICYNSILKCFVLLDDSNELIFLPFELPNAFPFEQ